MKNGDEHGVKVKKEQFITLNAQFIYFKQHILPKLVRRGSPTKVHILVECICNNIDNACSKSDKLRDIIL